MSTSVAKLGMNQKLKINSVLVTAVKDVTLTRTTDEIDVTTRGNGGYHSIVPGLRTVEMSFQLASFTGETGTGGVISYLNTCWNATTEASRLVDAEIVDVDGTTETSVIDGDWALTQFNRSESLADSVTYDVTLKLVSLSSSSSSSSSNG